MVRLGGILVAAAVLFLFCDEASGQMDPRVRIVETSPATVSGRIYGFIAQDVTLSCYVEDLPNGLNVRWQRVKYVNGSEKVDHVATDEGVEDNARHSIEKPTPYTWRLRIKALRTDDEAEYVCFVQTTGNNNRKQDARSVIVTEKPMIKLGSSGDTTATEGDEVVQLQCNATGRPNPTIIWRRGGNAVLPGGGVNRYTSVLKIYNVEYNARGKYVCEAVNDVGRDTRELILTVNFKPRLSFNRGGKVLQAIGYRQQLICYIEAYPLPELFNSDPSKIQVSWTKGTSVVEPNENIQIKKLIGASEQVTYELVFLRVREEDYGEYRCNVQNSVGSNSITGSLSPSDTPQPDKNGQIGAANTVYVSIVTMILMFASWGSTCL